MKLMRTLRNGVAGALIAAVPMTAAVAATRPNAAVPVAGSTAVVAQDGDYDGRMGIAWPAIAVIVAALIVGVWIALDDDDDGEGALSRA